MKFSHSSVYMLLFIALVSPLPDVPNTIRALLTRSTLTCHRVPSVKYRTVKFNLYACSPKPLRAGCRFITTHFFSLSLPQGLGGCTCPAVTLWLLLPAECWPGWLGAHGLGCRRSSTGIRALVGTPASLSCLLTLWYQPGVPPRQAAGPVEFGLRLTQMGTSWITPRPSLAV